MNKFCKECGNEFKGHRKKQIFCSNKCSSKNRKDKLEPNVICTWCGKGFRRKPSEMGKTNNFCSRPCVNLHKKKIHASDEMRLNRFIKSSWTNMNLRAGVYRDGRDKNKCYEGIEVTFTRLQYKIFCKERIDEILLLKRPSVDRKDSTKDYSLENIQIIELKDNVRKKKVGSFWLTKAFGIKRGVTKTKSGKYVAKISTGKKVKYLGNFEREEDAYEAFREAYFEKFNKYPW